MSYVQILLAPGARVPRWLVNQPKRIRLESRSLNNHRRRLLILSTQTGEALFIPGGSVAVKLSSTQGFVAAFKPLAVLQIWEGRDKVISNHFCCDFCLTNTGIITEWERSSLVGRMNAKLKCKSCGKQWERRGI